MGASAALDAADAGAALRSRLAGFAGFLRGNGFDIGGGQAPQIVDVASRVGLFDRELLRFSLKAMLCGRGDEWRRFDELFDAWFNPPNRVLRKGRADARSRGAAGGGERHTGAGLDAPQRAQPEAAASPHATERSADFSQLLRGDELHDLEALMRRFARRLKLIALRRDEPVSRGRRLDMRRTIRRSVASGGTPLELAWRNRRRQRPRLVLLLDVSRSMSAYSFFWLRLARALEAELTEVYCYIFHTRVTGVSDALRDPDPWRSQERLHLLAAGWAGGTRIGESLAQFQREHAPRLVHSRTALIVVSDGYDTGEPALLDRALAALRRRARRIVWLNPLLDRPGYRPEARGMKAALPHLDLLAAGAGLSDVERVLPRLVQSLR